MKTITKNDKVLRVSDYEAEQMVKFQRYSYCPKSKWKKSDKTLEIISENKIEEKEPLKKKRYQKPKKS